MKVVKLPQALADLIETADFIAEDNPKVADRFFDAFEETIEVLSRTPKIGRLRRFCDAADIRMWFIRGFDRSLIFYTEDSDEIVILCVIHAARDHTRFFDNE